MQVCLVENVKFYLLFRTMQFFIKAYWGLQNITTYSQTSALHGQQSACFHSSQVNHCNNGLITWSTY